MGDLDRQEAVELAGGRLRCCPAGAGARDGRYRYPSLVEHDDTDPGCDPRPGRPGAGGDGVGRVG